MNQKSISISSLPKRPVRSQNLTKVGKTISLQSNHFRIDLPSDVNQIYIFCIEMFDEENIRIPNTSRGIIRQVMKNIERKLKELFKRHYLSGLTIWATNDIIPESSTIVTSCNEEVICLRLKLVRQESIQNLLQDSRSRLELQQILNVAVKGYLVQKGYEDLGMNQIYYKKSQMSQGKESIQSNNGVSLSVIEGFFTHVQIFGSTPYLMVDCASRILRNETVYECIKRIQNQDNVKQYVKGLGVITTYGNQKMYKLSDIDFNLTPNSPMEHDSSLTFAQYYKKHYNITLKFMNQPMVMTRPKWRRHDKIYLVPELLRTTGLTDSERTNGKLMAEISKTTKKEPTQRDELIKNCARELRGNFIDQGYALNPVKDLNGIQLFPPQVKSVKWEDVDQRRNVPLITPLKSAAFEKERWLLLYKSKCQQDEDDIDYLLQELTNAAKKMGVKMESPYLVTVKSNSWINDLSKEVNYEKPTFVLSVVNDREANIYQLIKKYLFNEMGIPHQNIQMQKFLKNKNKFAIAQKIVLQMNVKIGCPLWQVENLKTLSQRTMLVGLDVYHKTITGKKSVAGFVATLDPSFTQYWTASIILGVGQELTTNVSSYVIQAIQQYQQKNNFYPDTIIVYRDGVGDSQVESVVEIETKSIIGSFKTISKDYCPAFAEILVNKRISHRFFVKDPRDQLKLVNPPSGTIVADKVIEDGFCFKLTAQLVTSGTATPTHYHIVYNTTKLQEEEFWQLTYWQCFNYANWQGPVRVPAVVQYAHKLAYLVGESIQLPVQGDIQKSLYFL